MNKNGRKLIIYGTNVTLHHLRYGKRDRKIKIRQPFDYDSKCHIHISEFPMLTIV